jgi:hypothetical protein
MVLWNFCKLWAFSLWPFTNFRIHSDALPGLRAYAKYHQEPPLRFALTVLSPILFPLGVAAWIILLFVWLLSHFYSEVITAGRQSRKNDMPALPDQVLHPKAEKTRK